METRILLSTRGTPAWNLETVAERARAYGYAGIDLRLIDGEVISCAAVRAHLGRLRALFAPSDLPLVVLATSVRIAQATTAATDRVVADALEWIALAEELDVPMIRFFGGPRPEGTSIESAIEIAAQVLNRVAPEAERAGVILGLETHDDFSSAGVVAATLARVDSPAVGAIWDMLHTLRMDESPDQALAAFGARVVNIHIKDARRVDANWQLVLMGQGAVPVDRGLDLARARGYSGYVTVEWEKKWHPELAEPEIAYPQHMAYLRRYFAEPSPGPPTLTPSQRP
jgi:fatty-acyl-CoA synthase